MMKIIKGIFFYRLNVEKSETFKNDLLQFLFTKKLSNKDLALVEAHDFNTDESVVVNHINFDLNIKSNLSKPNEVILLFKTELDTNGFNDLIEGFFE